MMKKRNVRLGDTHFVGPFMASGFWVSDALGNSVAECRSQEIAKAMAAMLNAHDDLRDQVVAPCHGCQDQRRFHREVK